MTFLEIARAVRQITGIQGIGPVTVEGNIQGMDAMIAQFVRDAYTDIQNLREDFGFLKRKRSFTLVTGKDTYSLSEIFTPAAPELRKYILSSFLVKDLSGRYSYLQSVPAEDLEAFYLNEAKRGLPKYVGITSAQEVLLKDIPDATYELTFKYYRSPHSLVLNADVPILPISFHKLIVYKALEKMAVYLSQPELFRSYANETVRMIGQLMRDQVPKKRFKGGPLV